MPAKNWPLTVEGERRAKIFAATVSQFQPTHIYSSSERKARETAAIIAAAIGCQHSPIEGVQEHDRSEIIDMPGHIFHEQVKLLLNDPQNHKFGGETGVAVVQRFEGALLKLLRRHPGETIAVASHGTAITLFLAAHGLVDPVPFWQRLELPALVSLAVQPWRLLTTINPHW